MSPQSLGAQLVAQGLISQDQLDIALAEQKHRKLPLEKLLVSLGFFSEQVLTDIRSEHIGQERIHLTNILPDQQALSLFPKEFALRHRLLPLGFSPDGQTLLVGMADPHNIVAIDQMHQLLQGRHALSLRLIGDSEALQAIEQLYGHELSIDGILREIETGEADHSQALPGDTAGYRPPVVRLVDAILADGVQRGASDIHFEPEQRFLRIRYRIDGVMRQIRSLHADHWPAMLVRLKVLSGMNIAESRAPQDGRIRLTVAGRPIDFRTAVQAITWGENFVARILDQQQGILPLAELGVTPHNQARLQRMLSRPEGLLLVTGPTGSGKTTTLYSMLASLNSESVHIMTLEDPVEYPMPLIRQASLNESARMDFANGIRSMMRQDPDIILVGEIRDSETAEMALRAAMTGHQVFSTLHANSALGAIPRLFDIGIRPDILSGNLIGIVAQRLLRKLCMHCRITSPATVQEAALLGLAPGQALYRASGCPHCGGTGYRGRSCITETLCPSPELDDLIARRASQNVLRQTALQQGYRPMADDARQRVRDGITTLEEACRVVDLTSDRPSQG